MDERTPSNDLPPVKAMNGVITRMLHERGFAFVRGDDNISRFAHAQNFIPRLAFDMAREGMEVRFVPGRNENGKGNGECCLRITLTQVSV